MASIKAAAVAALAVLAAAPPCSAQSPPAPLALIDINTASKEALEALPGIRSWEAMAIINGRPYRRKEDLVRNKVIPPSLYEGLKDRVIADRM